MHFENYKQSRISPFDEYALRILLRSLSPNSKQDLVVLEIGSWLGAGSTQIFSEFARTIVCVDHWHGNDSLEHKNITKEIDPYAVFLTNISPFNDRVVSIRGNSSEIDNLLKNNIFDFIFIDGDHRYEQSKKDINNCLPKLNQNRGIICGHDCEGRVNKDNYELLANNLDKDHIDSVFDNFRHCHPGVIFAVNELLVDCELFAEEDNKISLSIDGELVSGFSSIWYKKV